MSGTKINQKEYLKKYLSNDKDSTDKKKKKKKSKDHAVSKKSNVIIIDDDIDLSHMQQISDKDLEVYAIGEDAPQIVGVFDERPAELIAREDYKQSEKWKVLAAVDGSLTINNFDKAGKMKSSSSHGPREPDKKFRKYESDEDDMSPVRARRNKSESSDASPVRRNQTAADPSRSSRFERRDVSPERRNAGGSSKDQRRRPSRSLSPNERHTSSRRKPSPARHLPREGTDKNTRRWSDASPSRKVKENSSRKRNKDSPEKRRQQRDVSLKRRQSPDDSSPPRKRDRNVSPKRQRDPEASQSKRVKTPPSRRRRDSDAAPPRRRRDSDASPPRRRRDSDASPPRRRRDSDASPPRKTSMSSPPRINRKDWDGKRPHSVDTSPPRRPAIKRERSPDASPPRRHHRDRSPSRNIKPSVEILNSKKLSRWSRDRSQCPPPEVSSAKMSKTLDGKAAGLQDAQAVRQENDSMRKREKEIFDRMSEEMSGRNAEAVVRDRKRGGMVQDVDAEMEVELEKMRKEQERKAVYDRWGKGVKQVEDYKTRKQEEDHEFSKPVARYADDSDLDALLRSKERDGDPMLEYLRSKQSTKESGKPAKPIYRGAFPENRFSIRPGYRWDGVDRSSGFEKRWFDVQSKKKAGEEEEYKYMTEDM